jgi:hypothetical protein
MSLKASLQIALRDEFLRSRGEQRLWDLVRRGDPTSTGGQWALDRLCAEIAEAMLPVIQKGMERRPKTDAPMLARPPKRHTGEPVAKEVVPDDPPKPPRRTYTRRSSTTKRPYTRRKKTST